MYARIYTYAYDTHVYKYVYYNSYTTQVSVTAVGGGGGGARLVPDGIYVRILQHIRTYTTYMYTIRTYNTICTYVYIRTHTIRTYITTHIRHRQAPLQSEVVDSTYTHI